MTGLVADIQRFSIHDGPGIRTTAFLQGCTLRCAWCHNPECIPDAPQLRYVENRCVHCGACQQVCPTGVHQVSQTEHLIDRSKCIACGKCVDACPAQALSLSARIMTAEELAKELLEDFPYYKASDGGITLSGGEPFKQGAFAVEVLRLCRQAGAHTAVETALQVPRETLIASLPHTDLYLADYKLDEGLFEWTGGTASYIENNLAFLHGKGASIILRCPIIPGINDTEKHLESLARVLTANPRILCAELMAYHKLGSGKYQEIGQEYTLKHIVPMSVSEKADFLLLAQSILPGKVQWS